jgi:very-short-patch-repair endonuclease
MNWILSVTNRISAGWASLQKAYRRIRRKYIESKKSAIQAVRWTLSPFLAIRFILEQITWGHFPTLDKNMFMTDSILERWLYYDIRRSYRGKIIPQYPIGPYWADFAIPQYKLVIELDGHKYHKDRKDHDRKRDAYMYRQGWKVMRFSYHDVRKKRAQTIAKIINYTNKIDQQKNTSL